MKVRDLYSIKVTRAALLVYAGDECHWYSDKGYLPIYKADPESVYKETNWPEVQENVQVLCEEYGIRVVIINQLLINIELTI